MPEHSAAKLTLLDQYLEDYFPAIVRDPRQEVLNLTFVDGFCGGGRYSSFGGVTDGSPLILFKAVERARRQLNAARRKPLGINAEYHFVDSRRETIDFLRAELVKEGLLADLGRTIHLHNCEFVTVFPQIKQRISNRTRRSVGRSVFVLDQKGWKDAPFATVREILQSFSGAEVILTFAIDWFIDNMSGNDAFLRSIKPVEVSTEQIREWLDAKDEPGWRYAIQRGLKDHIQTATGAQFISPFFIRSDTAHRSLWVVHLSNHYTARNVMVDTHWNTKNHSIHPGRGGLEILGFDINYDPSVIGEMMFAEHDRDTMHERLTEDLLRSLRDGHGLDPVPYRTFLSTVVNKTPARLLDLDTVTGTLIGGQEIAVRDKTGSPRRSRNPSADDLISYTGQMKMKW
nr:three-Cys-motif partner protein TcmP [Oricola sp.]